MNKHTAFFCLLFLVTCSNSFSAEQKSQQIPDVVVKINSDVYTTSGGAVQQITRHELSITGATTLSDALRSLAGLQLHDASGNGKFSSFSMRGFGANASSNSLLLINGMPISNPDLMPPDINILPLEDINRIEVTSGSESILYGDQAVGGIVNIITDNSNDNNTRIQCGVGSYNSKQCHARIVNHLRAINYQINLTSSESDNYREHNYDNNNTVLGSISYHAKHNDLAVDYKFTNEMMQYPGALTSQQVFSNRRQASNSTDYFKDNNQFLHARFSQSYQKNISLSTDTFVRGMSGTGVLSAPFSQSRGGFFLKPQLKIKQKLREWLGGIEAHIDRYHLESPYGLTNNHQLQTGFFGLLTQSISKHLSIIIGGRGAQQNTQLNTNVTAYTINRAAAATVGLTYGITDEISLYLRSAGNYRFPKAEENSAGHVPLRTQRGTSYESGVKYDDRMRMASLSIYQLKLRDEIAFDPLQTPQNPFGTNTNLAPTIRNGGSLSLKLLLLNRLVADGQINYADARFSSGIDAGKQIPLVSKFITRGGLLYRFNQQWHAYAEAIFTGKQFPANDNANITGGTGGYTTYNCNIRYQYHSFIASLHINNIFNKSYYLYTVYQTSTEYFYPAPDRNYMLTVIYTFE